MHKEGLVAEPGPQCGIHERDISGDRIKYPERDNQILNAGDTVECECKRVGYSSSVR